MLKNLVLTYFKGNGGLAIYQSLAASGKKSKKSKIGFLFLFSMLVLLYVWMISSSFLATVLVSPKLFYLQAFTLSLMFGIMFSYTSVENILIKAKDLTFLTPLPIEKRTLNLSRLVILYFEVLVESVLVYVPFIIISALKLEFSLLWYLFSFIAMLALPILSTGFMATFAYIGAKYKIVRKINIFIVYSLSFITILLIQKNGMSENAIEGIIANYEGRRACAQFIPYVATVTALVIGLSIIFVFTSIALSSLRECYKENDTKGKKESIKAQSVLKALVERELSIVKSNNTFLSELLMEQIIPVVILIIYIFMGVADNVLLLFSFDSVAPYKGFIILALLSFFYSISMVSSTSVSREGKDFYILKVYPIKAKDRVNAKVVFHLLFTLVFALPIQLAFTLLMKIDIAFILCSIPLFTAFIFVVANVGLWRDFSDCKLDWKIPTVAVKQNTNGLFAMLFMLPIIIASGFFVFFAIKWGGNSLIVELILMVLYLLIGFLFHSLAMKKAKEIL